MASFSFQSRDFLGYPNQNPNYNHLLMDYPVPAPDFDLSDYLIPEAGSEEDSTATNIGFGCDNHQLQNPILQLEKVSSYDLNGDSGSASTSSEIKCKSEVKRIKMDVGFRVAFRTKSELEIMDDGFKWRKYGKKSVKNSPNPRQELLPVCKWRVPCEEESGEGQRRFKLCDNDL
ncbi:probable WRKY transcription factor 48 isoform X2 [Macadamia integrifolia]|uniref:probable WRKY transcription factor 48 isoform X2 n=1 Tax=Macadamia integrifolia TaxID=60698 RepID=UPI001C4E3B2B|nr:probable WRKY transcription factor 48 isoform X2 [Macadamia integrifolia]